MKRLKTLNALTAILVPVLMVTLVVHANVTPDTVISVDSCCVSGSDGPDSLTLISGSDTVILSVPRRFDVEGIVTVVAAVILIAVRLLLPTFLERNSYAKRNDD